MSGTITLESIAGLFGCSKQNVAQIEFRAMRKLRLAVELEELLGIEASQDAIAKLRGKTLRHFEAAVQRAREAKNV